MMNGSAPAAAQMPVTARPIDLLGRLCVLTGPGERRCRSIPGYTVDITEDKGVATLALRRANRPLAMFPAAGAIFASRFRPAAEWRGTAQGGLFAPFALLIIADYIDEKAAKSEQTQTIIILVRIEAQVLCSMVFIDMRTTPDAMVLARQTADAKARTFSCRDDPPFVAGGKSAVANELLKR